MGALSSQVQALLSQRPIPIDAFLDRLAAAARLGDPEDFPEIALLSRMEEPCDEYLAFPAIASMPAWGLLGIKELVAIVRGRKYSNYAQEILVGIGAGIPATEIRLVFTPESWSADCWGSLPEETVVAAKKALSELVLSARTDTSLFDRLIQNELHQRVFRLASSAPRDRVFFRLFGARTLSLNQEILNEFASLLSQGPRREQALHKYIEANPIFLDPLATKVDSKVEFGSDYIPDFVIRRLDDEYLVVEI
jgi:hypothetical protein